MSWFGKYRGTVVNNVDPYQQGRLQVNVPAVLGTGDASWALPCTPYAGPGVGLLLIPPNGANVWVEFEGGNSGSPIWTGCFWNPDDAPVSPAVAETKVLKTDLATITVSDVPGKGEVTIELASGAKVTLTAQGIEIVSGGGASVKLTAAQVSVNDGALEVA
jgi:uncharacterized protein involved in type VI secretion and phage assembly